MADLLQCFLLPLQQIYSGTITVVGRTTAITPVAKGQMDLQRRFFRLLQWFWPTAIVQFFCSVHCMKNHKSGTNGFMAVKLDMSNAYDHVEWDFLESLMRKMGFCMRWINLMMECIKTVSYSILVNREPNGLIQPSRGIQRGDPLSPFLFLLCTEGLHGLIQKAARVGDSRGFSLRKREPKLTHLFFADDNLLFCWAIPEECDKVLKTLSDYEASSGQKSNKDKNNSFLQQINPNCIQEYYQRNARSTRNQVLRNTSASLLLQGEERRLVSIT